MAVKAKPTIHAVAERAGVSIASVSRVVNGIASGGATEERIRRAIKELGYEPNSAARALKVNASEQICIALPDLSNPVYQSMIRGVQKGFKLSKYRLMLSPSLSSTEEVITQLKSLGRNYADGLIINALVADEEVESLLSSLRIPVVIIGSSFNQLNFDSIQVDSVQGATMAVEYLLKKNRKEVLFLNGPWITNPAKRREEGFLRAMKAQGVKSPEKDIANAKAFNPQAAVQALTDFPNIKKYSAILCANDFLAAGTIKFLTQKKIRVPEDVAVIGIDNTDLAPLLNPTLTSVDFKAEYRGELAAKYLLDRLENPDLAPRKVKIEPELVIRESA
ncbi:MAG: LacI family transcriptional regulator [Actinobacteria bacterium]|nr:LacI family transcriptional regulator [Actinomycetota bacterium]